MAVGMAVFVGESVGVGLAGSGVLVAVAVLLAVGVDVAVPNAVGVMVKVFVAVGVLVRWLVGVTVGVEFRIVRAPVRTWRSY